MEGKRRKAYQLIKQLIDCKEQNWIDLEQDSHHAEY